MSNVFRDVGFILQANIHLCYFILRFAEISTKTFDSRDREYLLLLPPPLSFSHDRSSTSAENDCFTHFLAFQLLLSPFVENLSNITFLLRRFRFERRCCRNKSIRT